MVGYPRAPATTPLYYRGPSKIADTSHENCASLQCIPGTYGRVVPLLHPPISRRRDMETPCRAHTVGQTLYSSERQSVRNLNKHIRKIGVYPLHNLAGKARIETRVFSDRPASQELSQTDSDSLALLRRQRHSGYRQTTVRPRRCRSTPDAMDASID